MTGRMQLRCCSASVTTPARATACAPVTCAWDSAPRTGAGVDQGWGGHLFVNMDSRWVLRDITLDGNTFRSSHHVDKKKFVTDLGFGLAFAYDNWKFALARYFRTQEFEEQRERPVYGSFTIGRRF